jgi:hypothetical protein
VRGAPLGQELREAAQAGKSLVLKLYPDLGEFRVGRCRLGEDAEQRPEPTWMPGWVAA